DLSSKSFEYAKDITVAALQTGKLDSFDDIKKDLGKTTMQFFQKVYEKLKEIEKQELESN
ncbi:MAG: hypothetical protein ABRQ38_01985, partial [Candidatus Eremiobacterota bacterium]